MEEQITAEASTSGAKLLTISVDALQNITMQTVSLMGFSFIAGTLFTVLLLIVLDTLKKAREIREEAKK